MPNGNRSEDMRMLLDTNILLLHLSLNILASAPSEAEFFISVISEAEALRHPGLGDDELHKLDDLLNIMTRISVDQRIARRAATLGRTRHTKLPDLLIAATALELDMPLITRNLRDFKDIPELEVRDKI